MVKGGSLSTCFSLPCATLHCLVYFQVNVTGVWSFLDLFVEDICLVDLFALPQVLSPNPLNVPLWL